MRRLRNLVWIALFGAIWASWHLFGVWGVVFPFAVGVAYQVQFRVRYGHWDNYPFDQGERDSPLRLALIAALLVAVFAGAAIYNYATCGAVLSCAGESRVIGRL